MRGFWHSYGVRISTYLLVLVLGLSFSLVTAPLVGVSPFALLAISIVIFCLIFRCMKLLTTKRQRLVFVLLVVLGLVLLVYNARTKGVFMTGVDWKNFDNYANDALASSDDIFQLMGNSFDPFVFFIAIIYKVFGANINQVFFYIYPLALLLFYFSYKLAYLLSSNKIRAAQVALLILAWPMNIIFSVSVLREIPIQLMLVVSFYYFLLYAATRNYVKLLWALAFAILAAALHAGLVGFVVIFGYLALQAVNARKDRYRLVRPLSLGVVVGALLFLMMTPLWAVVTKQFGDIESVDDVVQTLEIKNEALVANTNYVNSVPQTLPQLLADFPYRLVMFGFSPLPWQVYDVSTVAALFDSSLHVCLVVVVGWIIFRRRDLDPLSRNAIFVVSLCIVATYSLFCFGTNNFGTAMRHRTKIVPIAIATIIPATDKLKRGEKNEKKQHE